MRMKSWATIMLVSFCAASLSHADPVILLTPEEAARIESGDTAVSIPQQSSAPKILIDEPSQATISNQPFAIHIRFTTSDDAGIELGSVKVEIVKLVPILITARLKLYLSDHGIDVPEAIIPNGRYTVRVSLRDSKGRLGQTETKWIVK
jgi:hypothetical protein